MELSEGLLVHTPLAYLQADVSNNSEFSTGWFNVRGQARLEGMISSDKVATADYPRLEWSMDGATVDKGQVIAALPDPGPGVTNTVYEIDERNLHRFVRLLFKHESGVGQDAAVRLELYAKPGSGGPLS